MNSISKIYTKFLGIPTLGICKIHTVYMIYRHVYTIMHDLGPTDRGGSIQLLYGQVCTR